ncbi:MAG: RNA methyltransferase [Erysipelotrichaceae bacterium]|nr:RNA methyltransferase [Erysipelotrichaceae bacterium]
MIIEGAIAVKAALNSRYRKVYKIYIAEDKHTSDVSYITQQAYTNRLTVERCSKEKIDELATGKTHGGIIADVEPRKFQAITSLLTKEKPFLALIEGVEDSYNLGYIMRSLYAFGCDGIVLPKRDWNFEDATMIKSSAGASEFIPIHLCDDMNSLMQLLHENDFEVVSAYRGKNSKNLYNSRLSDKAIMICIGGPLRGLSREVLDNSDKFVYIPYANDFRNALNAASAAVVMASEVFRQNHKGD